MYINGYIGGSSLIFPEEPHEDNGEQWNGKMHIDELMTQKEHVKDMINGLISKYGDKDGGYRIKSEMEHIVPGICGLPPDRECKMRADEGMGLLLFLMEEKKAMFDAVVKCQKENKRNIVGVHESDFKREFNVGERIMIVIKELYGKPDVRRETRKNDKFGYDVILTRKSRIDGGLLDGIHDRLSRKLETLRQERLEIDNLEVDYKPAVDYSQYYGMDLEKCLCALKERGAIKEWKTIETEQ